MTIDLTATKTDILMQLEHEGFATFFSESSMDGMNVVYWDTKRHPAVQEFLQVAKRCNCPLVVFFERTFSQASIDDTLERLQDSELSLEEKRSYALKLKELQKFEGFTCELDVAFTHDQQVYLYQLRTDWFEEFEDIFADVAVGELDTFEEDEDEGPVSGYFSRN
jgi:hypothetical protein